MAVLAVSFLLFLLGSLFWLQKGLKPVVQEMKSQELLTIYLSTETLDRARRDIEDSIRITLGSSPGFEVHSLRFFGSHEFLKELTLTHPALRNQLINLGSEMARIVPRYFSLKGRFSGDSDSRKLRQSLQEIRGVGSVEASSHRFKNTIDAFVSVRTVVRILLVGVWLALISCLAQFSRLNAQFNRDAISLFKLMGANGIFLRVPGMIHGVLVAVLGSGVCFLVWFLFSDSFTSNLMGISPLYEKISLPVQAWPLDLLMVGILTGAVAGFLGGGWVEGK